MKSKRKLGVWMDHSTAHLMEFTSDAFEVQTIEAKIDTKEKKQNLGTDENSIREKKQQLQLSFYRKLGEVIKNYYRVILFGPTDAKIELFNLLSEDERFLKIKMEIKDTDKMTENQKQSFVNSYFSKA
jgi:hypothetical protein